MVEISKKNAIFLDSSMGKPFKTSFLSGLLTDYLHP